MCHINQNEMKVKIKVYRLILRILGSLALVGYILFLIGEKVPLFNNVNFTDITVYLLFIVFLAGYVSLWKYEIISGILLIAWHGIQWCLVFWIWEDGEMTLIFGFPIAIIGILVLIYGIRQKIIASSEA